MTPFRNPAELLDQTCNLQRLPDPPVVDAWGQSDIYTTYESDVPCRLEYERTGVQSPVGGVRRWIVFIFQEITDPALNDRVVIGTRAFKVLERASWTAPAGGHHHWELACEEVEFA